jgi:hypothetical protein
MKKEELLQELKREMNLFDSIFREQNEIRQQRKHTNQILTNHSTQATKTTLNLNYVKIQPNPQPTEN